MVKKHKSTPSAQELKEQAQICWKKEELHARFEHLMSMAFSGNSQGIHGVGLPLLFAEPLAPVMKFTPLVLVKECIDVGIPFFGEASGSG
jgi:hypothetical protein